MLSLAPTQALHIVQEPKNSNVLSLTPPPPSPLPLLTSISLTWITLSISVVFWKSYSNEKWICPTFSLGSELSMYMSTIDTLRFWNWTKGKNKCLNKCRIVNRSLTVALSLSLFIVAPRESPSAPELEPAGDLICVLDDLQGGLRWNWNFN